MKHEIGLNDLLECLDAEISVATAINKKGNKSLTFNPASLKYRVKFNSIDKNLEQISNSYLDPLIAMAKYNDFDV